jgi:hypothetical protein
MAQEIRQITTSYVHSTDPNLLNIHKAMVYRDNEPHVRVTLGSDNITITGDVNLVDNVRVNNSLTNPVPVFLVNNTVTILNTSFSITNFPTTSTVYQSTIPWVVTGTVAVNNLQTSITVTNFTSTVNIASMPAVSGTVAISSLPAVTGTVTVNGSVTVTNFTSTVYVSNIQTSVTVTNFTSTVNINSMPSVTISNTITFSNTSIAVTNFPTTSTVYQGTTPWITSGTVDITSMPAVAITGTVTIAPADPEIGTAVTYVRNDNNTQLDLSGRLRISKSGQQWWYVPSIDKDGDLRYGEYNTGTLSANIFVQNLASVHLTSGTAPGGQSVRYSRRRHKLRPGVSHQWMSSMNWDGTQTNVTKRVGMFTSFNGYFFELTDDLYAVSRRRLTDGTLVETRVRRDAFSHDRLDGTNNATNPTGYNWVATTSSGLVSWNTTTVVTVSTVTNNQVWQVTYTHDGTADERFTVGDKVVVSGVNPVTFNNCPIITALTTNTIRLAHVVNPGSYISMSGANISKNGFTRHHTHFIDFNGSRSGHVRFCLMGPLGPETIHVMDFSDAIGSAATSAPALMERSELINTGVVSYLPSLTTGGSSFNIEAELELNPGFGVASALIPIAYNKNSDVGKEKAILGVGLRAGEPYQRADLQVNRFQMVDLGNINPQNSGIFQWRLVLNPTLIGTIPTPIDTGKASRYWDYSGAVVASTGTGITLMSGYAQGTYTGDTQTALNFLNMGSNLAYDDADRVVLLVKLLVGGTDNSSVVATIDFGESL